MRKNRLLSVERSKEAIELSFTQAAFRKSFLTLTQLEWHTANHKHHSKLSLQRQYGYGRQRRFLFPFLFFFLLLFEEDYSYVKIETTRFIITLSTERWLSSNILHGQNQSVTLAWDSHKSNKCNGRNGKSVLRTFAERNRPLLEPWAKLVCHILVCHIKGCLTISVFVADCTLYLGTVYYLVPTSLARLTVWSLF